MASTNGSVTSWSCEHLGGIFLGWGGVVYIGLLQTMAFKPLHWDR
jgi:hypothetical protein